MDQHSNAIALKQLQRTQAALNRNNMETFIANSAAEVTPLLATLLAPGQTVSCGGSETLRSCGVVDFLRAGDYVFWDRDAPGADRQQVQHDAFCADAYLASANAVTEQGEVYEVDGNGNRVAAIAYGPSRVVLVVGRNKIVPDLAAAEQRRRHLAAPANCLRVGAETPCAKTGLCADCRTPQRICCIELVLRYQRNTDRIKVILVNEELGY